MTLSFTSVETRVRLSFGFAARATCHFGCLHRMICKFKASDFSEDASPLYVEQFWLRKVNRTEADITVSLQSVGRCLELGYFCKKFVVCVSPHFLFLTFHPLLPFRVSDKQTLEEILTPYIHPTESDPVKRQK